MHLPFVFRKTRQPEKTLNFFAIEDDKATCLLCGHT